MQREDGSLISRGVPAGARPGLVPRSRACRDGLVLMCDGYDYAPRWRPGERLEQLFEARVDELERAGRRSELAVDGPAGALTYVELDARANQLARFLAAARGLGPGDRVGLCFEGAVNAYLGILAVLKLGAAYVPLDPGFPPERIAYIAADAELAAVLSEATLADTLDLLAGEAQAIYVDVLAVEISAQPTDRLAAPGAAPDQAAGEDGPDADADEDGLCYVVYTSGTTGRPKGVAVSHSSICNFVRVAAEAYGIQSGDRVYQGLTIAFDFSIEEIWTAWMVGATLVPKPGGVNLIGPELNDFLLEQGVSALCCVPTLLATLEDDLPAMRFLLVSGEACPPDLAERWHRPGRRFLNVYGPTEATVSATWTVLQPGRPVTIGVPLPSYCTVILDPDENRALPAGAVGELGLAGIGLAQGYLGRPELTARAFLPDFLDLPENPSGRIYRTGDLCRVTEEGEIEHHGRIDTQIKLRGYRIEPGEIEAVLRQVPGVAQAAVSTCELAAGDTELVGYYTLRRGAHAIDLGAAYEMLRAELPAYMVPPHLEQLDALPLLPSGKLDRRALPTPGSARRGGPETTYVPPSSEIEAALASELAEVLGVPRVSSEAHFFEDLGANSLLLARWVARLRRLERDLPAISMRDIYLHPSVRALAAAVAAPGAGTEGTASWREPDLPAARGRPHHALCGLLQVLAFLAYVALASVAVDAGAGWLTAGRGPLELYARAVAFGAALLVGMALIPIIAKWVLIGRFTPRRIPIWSFAYLRFWIVKTLVIANPLALLALGSPLYILYLRALGAKVGRHTLILSRHVPVCADLVQIGSDCVINRDAFLNGYRARGGVIELGAVAIGDGAFVGERAVLDICTELGDGAELGHSSSLHAGQVVPAGECWHGSPGRRAPAGQRYQRVPATLGRRGGDERPEDYARAGNAAGRSGVMHGTVRLLLLLATVGPLEAALAALLMTHPHFLDRLGAGAGALVAAVLVFGSLALALLMASTVPRLLSRALEPGRVYRVHGLHYVIARIVTRTSNLHALTALFGDSVAIVHYLRLLGYHFGLLEQTGSNFGLDVRQDVPALSHIGTGTMVSDGLSIMNAEFSSASFRVTPVVVGARNFLGNAISFPAGAQVGDNCLLATKVMVPTEGPRRENVGLLGSPCFEIPRTVERDTRFDHLSVGAERRRRLVAKTRHNLLTMVLHLLVEYLFVLGLVLIALSRFGGSGARDWGATVAVTVAELTFGVVLFVLVERLVLGFGSLRPRFCSIYEPEFWRHERYWKVPVLGYLHAFDGTPLKGVIWRALGVRIGRRVFDDGCAIVERTLVSIGNDTSLNMGATLQSHSLEDGTFKSDHITVGAGCTVSTGTLVNYGACMEDGSVVEVDSFLMKGSYVTSGTRWRGNPATEISIAKASTGMEAATAHRTELPSP